MFGCIAINHKLSGGGKLYFHGFEHGDEQLSALLCTLLTFCGAFSANDAWSLCRCLLGILLRFNPRSRHFDCLQNTPSFALVYQYSNPIVLHITSNGINATVIQAAGRASRT